MFNTILQHLNKRKIFLIRCDLHLLSFTHCEMIYVNNTLKRRGEGVHYWKIAFTLLLFLVIDFMYLFHLFIFRILSKVRHIQ